MASVCSSTPAHGACEVCSWPIQRSEFPEQLLDVVLFQVLKPIEYKMLYAQMFSKVLTIVSPQPRLVSAHILRLHPG